MLSAPANDLKMIDGGTLAYLSRHSQGEREKNLRIVDCTNVPAKHLDYVSTVVLGLYKKDLQQAFHSAGASA